MNGGILLLFVVLLLALILCTYLEGDNCVSPMLEGMTSTSTSTANFNSAIYVADNGAKARISIGPKGSKVLTVTSPDGSKNTYITSSGDDINTYYDSNGNGGTANLTTDSNGSAIITVTDSNGITLVFTLQNGNINTYTYSTNSFDNYNHFTGSSHASIYYGPDGGTAKIIDAGNDGTIVITSKDGSTEIYYIDNDIINSSTTSYVGPNGGTAKIITDSNGKTAIEITGPNGTKIVFTEDNTYNNNTSNINNNSHYKGYNNVDVDTYYGPAGGSATTITGPKGNTAGAYTSPFGNTYTGATNNSGIYDNYLPKGIPRNQIPAGQEDLYILKSEVVPPVCPKCPDPIVKYNSNNGGSNNGGSNNGGSDFDTSKCPPCEPCGRCPEPAFDCKKVPNYKAFNQNYMPVPVLNDFGSFGM
jgi:hypothetical protein